MGNIKLSLLIELSREGAGGSGGLIIMAQMIYKETGLGGRHPRIIDNSWPDC